MLESKIIPIKIKKNYQQLNITIFQRPQLLTTVSYEDQTCTKDFSKVSTTLQYAKCWVVTTSGIAGLQGNSIKYHTLDEDGTQKVLVGCFNLLHDAHHSWGIL